MHIFIPVPHADRGSSTVRGHASRSAESREWIPACTRKGRPSRACRSANEMEGLCIGARTTIFSDHLSSVRKRAVPPKRRSSFADSFYDNFGPYSVVPDYDIVSHPVEPVWSSFLSGRICFAWFAQISQLTGYAVLLRTANLGRCELYATAHDVSILYMPHCADVGGADWAASTPCRVRIGSFAWLAFSFATFAILLPFSYHFRTRDFTPLCPTESTMLTQLAVHLSFRLAIPARNCSEATCDNPTCGSGLSIKRPNVGVTE